MQDSASSAPQTITAPPKKSLWNKLGFGVWRADQQSEGYLFLLPSLIGFILFVILPIIASLILSFYKWDLLTPAEFVGAKNYVDLATTDPLMGQVLANTFFYMLTIAPIQLALGFILAVMLNSGLRGMGVYRMIYFMPVVTSIVAAAMVFQFLLNRDSGALTAYMWWGVEKLFEYDFVRDYEYEALESADGLRLVFNLFSAIAVFIALMGMTFSLLSALWKASRQGYPDHGDG